MCCWGSLLVINMWRLLSQERLKCFLQSRMVSQSGAGASSALAATEQVLVPGSTLPVSTPTLAFKSQPSNCTWLLVLNKTLLTWWKPVTTMWNYQNTIIANCGLGVGEGMAFSSWHLLRLIGSAYLGESLARMHSAAKQKQNEQLWLQLFFKKKKKGLSRWWCPRHPSSMPQWEGAAWTEGNLANEVFPHCSIDTQYLCKTSAGGLPPSRRQNA